MWMQYMEPLRAQYGVRLGSPAVSSGPAGKQWMQDFLTLCSGRCNIDFIALREYGFHHLPIIAFARVLSLHESSLGLLTDHDLICVDWYGTDPDAFIAHLWDYHFAFNKTMWVTEWACHSFVNASENARCSEEGVADFMRRTQGFMDQTEWVERYAWFGAMTDLPDVTEVRCFMTSSL